jgi:hypothetical protein
MLAVISSLSRALKSDPHRHDGCGCWGVKSQCADLSGLRSKWAPRLCLQYPCWGSNQHGRTISCSTAALKQVIFPIGLRAWTQLFSPFNRPPVA